MARKKIEIYDTTLRDGNQGEGVNLSLADKLDITRELDAVGVDFVDDPTGGGRGDVHGQHADRGLSGGFGIGRRQGDAVGSGGEIC